MDNYGGPASALLGQGGNCLHPFGKIHKFNENFYTKKKADVVRVMVEVDDISAVPKTVKCSYKSIVDNKFRFYIDKLLPFATCLPVSQWTEGNYKSYEELEGRRESVEEGWEFRNEGTWRGGVARNSGDVEEEAENAERMEDEGADRVVGTKAGEGEEETQGEARYAAMNVINEVEPQMEPQILATDEERERRRKGKGICMDWAQAANEGNNEPDPVLSGSGSCDPLLVGGGLANQQVEEASEDADSKAGPMTGPMSNIGSNKDMPILISEGSQQDEDLGGEGGLFVNVESEVEKEKEVGYKNTKMLTKGGAVGMEEKRGMSQGSRGTAGSVPPGYTRQPRSQP